MRTTSIVVVFAAACLIATATANVRAAQDAAKTTWDGVYRDAQARTGEMLYREKCAQCHGPDGGGDNGPTLVGPVFTKGWDGIALSDLFDLMQNTAPATNPGSLNRDEVAALIAYVLELNGFPPGESDLPGAVDLLKSIRFVPARPDTSR